MKLNYKWGYLLVTLLIAMPLAHALDYLPIQLWDESRLAMNALEMYRSGKLIVTTYGGQPDMWNTKPPLLIWLEAGSLHLFGLSELSLRIPSLVASFLTCYLLYWFLAKKYKTPAWGIISCLVLVSSAGYVYLHRSRTADYDATLVFFTTAYILLFFLYLEEGARKYLYGFFAALVLAALTKGIAALILLPALFLYALFSRKLLPVLKDKHTYAGIALFIFFVAGYYLLREHYNPGFIKQVADNELGGRYLHVVDNPGPPITRWFYFDKIISTEFQHWMWWMVAAIISIPFVKDDAVRRLLIYALGAALCQFLVITFSASKFEWYIMPCYPFFAMIAGYMIYLVYEAIQTTDVVKAMLGKVLAVLFILCISYVPYTQIIAADREPWVANGGLETVNTTLYLKDMLYGKRPADGYCLVSEEYRADVSWYQELLETKGHPLPTVDKWELHPGSKAIIFNQGLKEFVEKIYDVKVIDEFRTVKVYEIIRRK